MSGARRSIGATRGEVAEKDQALGAGAGSGAGSGAGQGTDSGGDRVRALRHDIRGALSPAMLIADRLLAHDDPAVRRCGDVVLRSVERAVDLLADAPATPPEDR